MKPIPGAHWARLNEYLAKGQLNPPTTRRGPTHRQHSPQPPPGSPEINPNKEDA